MRKHASSFVAAALIALSTTTVFAGEVLHKFRSGSLPIRAGAVLQTEATRQGVIVIRGNVIGEDTVKLALRIDDAKSRDYSSRFNMGRVLPPGPFSLRLPLSGLKTELKRSIDVESIHNITLFEATDTGRAIIDHYAIEEAITLPDNALGYSFGKSDSPVFEGFTRVSASNSMFRGKNLRNIYRPGADPLLSSGINGIERITLPSPSGKQRLTLWTEETSAWQELRGFVNRRIKINGEVVRHETYDPRKWNDTVYFSGRDREVGKDNDIWDMYGKHRGGRISFDVDVANDNKIEIEIAGAGATALYVSAALIEKPGSTALAAIEERRKKWFNDKWKVDPTIGELQVADRTINLNKIVQFKPLELTMTNETGSSLSLSVNSEQEAAAPTFKITWENDNLGEIIEPMIWAGQRRLERVRTGGNLFTPRSSQLRSDVETFPLYANTPRRYSFWLQPKGILPAGTHRGILTVKSGTRVQKLPLSMIVPPITLPKVAADAGFYMLHASHLNWHHDLAEDKAIQNSCDLAFLSKLGIKGNAPALHVPYATGEAPFVRDTLQALQYANKSTWLAYHASFGLYHQLGIEKGAQAMARALEVLKRKNLPAPVWSMADEPGNASSSSRDMPKWIAAVRKAAPEAILAGHLNNPKDYEYLDFFDVAIINQGFGIDKKDIKSLKKANIQPWLYNTGQPRLTAGLWLWTTGADRYLQWHSRLPLGHPFDPTDGREGDVSMFPPMPTLCARQPDVHEFLLDMADGLADQRYLLWLSGQKSPEAIKLATAIRKKHRGDWELITGMSNKELKSLRIAIAKLALNLNISSNK